MLIDLKKIRSPKHFRLIWLLLVVFILWQVAGAMTRSTFLPRRIRKTLASYKKSTEKNETEKTESPQAKSPKGKQPSTPKNMFAPPPAMAKMKCTAVLGDQALINGKWYKVGSDVNGAKVIGIDPASVKIRWQEKEQTLVPFDVKIEYADTKKPSPNGTPPKKNGSGKQPGGNEPARRPPETGRSDGGPRGGFRTSDERRKMRERYLNASPEEQEEMRKKMEARAGERGRGRRGDRQRN